MRVVPLALRRDPLEVLAALAAEPGAFLLDVPDPTRPTILLGCAPRVELRVHGDGRVTRTDGAPMPYDPLAAIEAFVAEVVADVALPFPLGATVVGWLAYELGRFTVGGATAQRSDAPLAVLAHYDPVLAYDRTRGQYDLSRPGAASWSRGTGSATQPSA